MTGRNSGGVGRRLTGYMAAATILAASVFGIAWANSDKAQDKKNRQQQGAASQPTTGSQPTPKATDRKPAPVTRTIGAATVSVDPATGRLVPPTPEQAAALTAELYRMVSRNPDDIIIIQQEDGSQLGVLDDSYNEVAMATRDAKGNLRLHCIDTPDQAQRVLEGKANVGPVYNQKKAKSTGKKAAQKPGPSFTETE